MLYTQQKVKPGDILRDRDLCFEFRRRCGGGEWLINYIRADPNAIQDAVAAQNGRLANVHFGIIFAWIRDFPLERNGIACAINPGVCQGALVQSKYWIGNGLSLYL